MTSLLLAAAVVIAGPADARRNLGGSLPAGAECVEPGGVFLGDQASSMVPCVCISTEFGTFRHLGGTGAEGGECPRGVDRVKIDRNVGG